MRVYVESNFVLELALQQEQHEACATLVRFCEAQQIALVIPAYSLAEPFETIIRFDKERRDLSVQLAKQLAQLGRSQAYQPEIDALERVAGFLVRVRQDEMERLLSIQQRLLTCAEIIPLTPAILRTSIINQSRSNLSPQDSLVYSSVIDHLAVAEPAGSCFLNRNSKDFYNPDIVDNLQKLGCKLISRFDQGLQFVTSQLPADP